MKKAVIRVAMPDGIDAAGDVPAREITYVPKFYIPAGSRAARHTGPRISLLVDDRVVSEVVVAVSDNGKIFVAEDSPATPKFLE